MNQFVDCEMKILDSGFICSTVRIDDMTKTRLTGVISELSRTSCLIDLFESEILCFSSHRIDGFPKLKHR